MKLVVAAAVALALASTAVAAPEMPDPPLPGCDPLTGLCVTVSGPHPPVTVPPSQTPTVEVITISTEPGEMVVFVVNGIVLTIEGLRIHGGRAPIPAQCLARPLEPQLRAC